MHRMNEHKAPNTHYMCAGGGDGSRNSRNDADGGFDTAAVSHRMAVNEICLPHHFSINYILWPLVELNFSPISLHFFTLIRDHTTLSLFFRRPPLYL